MMGFEDALVHIKVGQKVGRESWGGKVVFIGPGTLGRKTLVFETQSGSEGIYVATGSDILAEDWVVQLPGAEVLASVGGSV